MSYRPIRHLGPTLLLPLLLVAAGCGGSSRSGGATVAEKPVEVTPGTPGGSLTFLSSSDADSLDPGITDYSIGFMVLQATQRTLYALEPDDPTALVPDLAAGAPEISGGGRVVTVRLKRGIEFAPPVDREVTSEDVKYGFERVLSKQVPSSYAGTYFNSLVGAPETPNSADWRPIRGIETPDAHTLVFRLTRPEGGQFASTLMKGATAPVPAEYARPFDRQNPSTYGQHVVATGPYMVENDADGRLTGWTPGKQIRLVRNPNWDPRTDFRPAYLDTIEIAAGNQDVAVSARRTLSGSGMACCDASTLPVDVLRSALARDRSQIAVFPGRLVNWVALNTTVKPFDNLNVRRALLAAVDRSALRLTRGGPLLGELATGFLPPGMVGFEQAGGREQASEYDFNVHPEGDLEVAKRYMLAARDEGLPIDAEGRWTGGGEIVTVAPNSSPDDKTAEAFQAQAAKLGFDVRLRLVPREVVYTNFCSVPARRVGVCFVSFGSDTADPYSLMQLAFNGESIRPQGNLNMSQLNDPEVNDAMAAATALPPGAERADAWAKVNDLVVGQAPALPYLWPKAALASSRDVQLVPNAYVTLPDLSFTSIKR